MLFCSGSVLWAEQKSLTLTFGNLADWKAKIFRGETIYSVEQNQGKAVLHALAPGTASGLYRNVSLKSHELPVLRWSWKVPQTLPTEDAYRKSGDDFAARVYVIFPGRFFWQMRALVYVWSDKLPAGTILPNAHTANAAIIAVRSGNAGAGAWQNEARRYLDDYRSYFHSDPPDPRAVAVMTDGDNTGGRAEAWYGDIVFASE
jgi:hypothetical protein